MKNWFNRNYRTIIITSYIIPILFAAVVSIAHVISWYGITNPLSWAVYLSIGVEIAALSSLAGITVKVNKSVYIPFIIVTIIQFVGNIFFAYQFIDITNQLFKSWIELTDPIFSSFGWLESGSLIGHKRILALLSGGFVPLISLSFLHLLVSFVDNTKEIVVVKDNKEPVITNNEIEVADPIEEISNKSTKEETSIEDVIKEFEGQRRGFSVNVPEPNEIKKK